MQKLPFYFSIDFEDFSYDLCRAINHPAPISKEEALEISYQRVKDFSDRYFEGRKITFFVTGVLARTSPALIKRIYNDGHEIGCHYNFHDKINLSNREDFARNLDIAIQSIEDAIGEKPIGFRAPFFAIDEGNTWAYEELAKRFAYDSSYKTSAPVNEVLKNRQLIFDNHSIYEYCIFGLPVLNGKFAVRTGGTFMRLFSSGLTIKAMKKTHELGHVPLIYLHPYEMTLNADFRVSWSNLKTLSFPKRVTYWLRQIQWCKLGHNTVERKMRDICREFEHQGPMRLLLDKTGTMKPSIA